MESITKLYRIGTGPSSSHTMGPERAAAIFKNRYPDAEKYTATLYGSLAATGRGHLTDTALKKILGPDLDIAWKPRTERPVHPNALALYALDADGAVSAEATFYSIGGGAITEDGTSGPPAKTYHLTRLEDILDHCSKTGLTLYEYVYQCEEPDLPSFLDTVWGAMGAAIDKGLKTGGSLPGKLKLKRKARKVHEAARTKEPLFSSYSLMSAYALAVSEENAGGGTIVTAPTCGSCGVLPAVLRYLEVELNCDAAVIRNALATAGLIGNIVKHNGSISGAEAGCQAEVGTACAMAAAAATQALGGTLNQIEYAAEMGMEHHLGLTCDPVYGLVQIPCIERNAFAAVRALASANYAIATGGEHYISFDDVVQVMLETGKQIPSCYRETSKGGLARMYQEKHH